MNKIIDTFWNPTEKTAQGFKYASYIIFAPTMLFNFFLPFSLIVICLFIFFILRAIVSIRASLLHEIDKDKVAQYNDRSVSKRGVIAFSILFLIYIIGLIIFYSYIEGPLGFLVELFLAIILLPGTLEEIITLRRCWIKQDQANV